ncbi:Rad1-domain-containing protein [Aspergillus heteromorphus CBS 117.55]|uniref:Rad1-domain-containing protein n=1 Tax=Aspergillus heteromorphus CBS 117.55 TaxID=1448321 RepID=A0A317W3V8_9EURO|nr:Rad1-domain-containing protein [Aspergillus heteromorphus CBS 117.55]PWY80675.1 Rad1-domain-containing protein [Aspergillus heteromorphus CBS 117.55]
MDAEPIFTAISSNAQQLYILLQCIGFASKATVQITPDGLRFSAEELRVIQGLAFLDKALFASYTFNPPPAPAADDDDDNDEDNDSNDSSSAAIYYPCFVVSLSALLETLRILSINDTYAGSNASRASSVQPSYAPSSNAFNAPTLLIERSCIIRYPRAGAPLSITLTGPGMKTTCNLTTYEPEGSEVDIPLQRDAVNMKIIMRSAWLHNAITELAATNPAALKISASDTQEPFFALSGAGGPFSESSVEFSVDQGSTKASASARDSTEHRPRAKKARLVPTVTETFLVSPPSSSLGSRILQSYKFKLIQKATRAMAVANKVSIRGDRQGVLSLQFMIEFDPYGGGLNTRPQKDGGLPPIVAFVDFRFVPLLDEEGDGEDKDNELFGF